ncbi:hypothetical protein MPSEU_000245800 [Mayamaea pseudoterrestris]|nr:hypothetical protein MPSEU_000245800 [Mayamaea pseudoterrestris]
MNPPQSLFSPPAQQPLKKQRATDTPDRFIGQVDDAVSRRKAELANLQNQLSSSRQNNAHSDILARARMSLQNSTTSQPPAPPFPGQQQMVGRRTSDLFPEAPKTAIRPGPPHGNPSPSPPGTTPETAKVVRRLDVTFASNRKSVSPQQPQPHPTSALRSTSAPPQRPPPPGPPPNTQSEHPEKARPPPPPPRPSHIPPPRQGNPPPPPPPVGVAKPAAAAGAPPVFFKQQQPPPPPPPPTPTAPSVSFAAAAETLPELVLDPDMLSPPAAATHAKTSSMDIDFGSDSHDADFLPMATEDAPAPMQTPDAEASKPAKRRNTPYFARSSLDLSEEDEEDEDALDGHGTETPNTIDLMQSVSEGQDHPQQHHNNNIYAGTVSAPPDAASVDLRLAKELARAEQEKAQAMERVTELEQRLFEVQQTRHDELGPGSNRGSNGAANYVVLFDKINQYGIDVALDWARQEAANSHSNGVNDSFSEPTIPNQHMHRKTPMPRPKPAQEMNLEMDLLIETTMQCSHEFVDDDHRVVFIVRRPYGVEDDRELWLSGGQLPNKGYANKASVTQCRSIELVARIPFDDSVLSLFDEGNVRHQNALGDWEDFGNVYERSGPLGSILYVDRDEGTQKMYSLDDIFDNAIATRQFYCQSILSAATCLKRGKALSVAHTPPAAIDVAPLSPGKDVGVDTNDLPKPKTPKAITKKTASPAPVEDVPDVATQFFSMFISGIVWLLWSIFVRLPLRILFNVVALSAAVAIIAFAWVYLESGSNAAHFGSSVDAMFNQPGIM